MARFLFGVFSRLLSAMFSSLFVLFFCVLHLNSVEFNRFSTHVQCSNDLLVSGLLLNLDVDLISFHSGVVINGVCGLSLFNYRLPCQIALV